jgi:hypothetical protein
MGSFLASRPRHAAECKICAHPQKDEIERDFVNWRCR